uniref:Uncharacterized protein n=1 Tax=Timema bartmani TaxID=61472 RepID=A0A7R9EZC2_9NEOP|nr:unnamed protein product [Timema bartmani]
MWEYQEVSDYLIGWNRHVIMNMDCVVTSRISKRTRTTEYEPTDTESVSGPIVTSKFFAPYVCTCPLDGAYEGDKGSEVGLDT